MAAIAEQVKTVVASAAVGAGVAGVGGFLYISIMSWILVEPGATWIRFPIGEFFYALASSVFGGLAGLIAGGVFVLGMSRAWSRRLVVGSAASPSALLAAAVMIDVASGNALVGGRSDLGEAATFFVIPALLFAVTSAVLAQLHYDAW
jgi:hypothetical protein